MAVPKFSDRAASGTPKKLRLTHNRVGLAVMLSLATGIAALPLTVHAAPETGTTAVLSSVVKRYDIGPGSLSEVLSAFAGAAGVTLSFDASLLEGRASNGLQGKISVDEGFATLLDGSGFVHRFTATDTVVLGPMQNGGGSISLSPIIVEGELISRSLQETKTSVVVVAGEELERRGDFDIYDLVERTPGVGIAAGESGFVVRGINQRGPAGGQGLTVSTTVDGATISNSNRVTALGSYSTWDLEQVELLRGPQSTQTGRNALAGAVVIRSKDPVYDTEGKVRFELGNYGTTGAAFALNAPLVEDKLAFRIAGESLRGDGWISNAIVDTDEANARKDQLLRLSLRADPTDELDIILKHSISDISAGDDVVNSAFGLDDPTSVAGILGERETRIETTNLRMGYDINPGLRLEWETGYFESEYRSLEDFDKAATATDTRLTLIDIESIQHEFKLLFEGEKYKGVVGIFYTDFDQPFRTVANVPAELFNAGLAVFNTRIDVDQITTIETENYALFGEVEYQLTPKIDVTVGARYDSEETSIDSATVANSPNPVVNGLVADLNDIEGSSGSFEALLPKFALGYELTDDIRTGFTVQRAYRAGGSGNNLIRNEVFTFDAEFAWNYELSLRSQWLDDRLTVNANLFYMDWEDQQVRVQLSANNLDTEVQNAGKSRLYGGELDIRARPSDNLELFGSLAYVNTKFEDFVTTTANYTGNEFPEAPDIEVALGATKYFPSGWYVSGDLSHRVKSFSGPDNASIIEDRTLVNARVGYEGDDWDMYVYARNLFDERYTTTGQFSGGTVRIGEPRIVGLVGQVYF